MTRPLRRFIPLLVGAAILGAAIVVYLDLGQQLNESLGTTVASNVLLVVLILVSVFPIVAGWRREEDLQVKEDVLEKWDTLQALGGVRRDIGVLTRTDPRDPPAFTMLPAKVQQKLQRKYPELWQAWVAAKAARLAQTDRLDRLYLDVRGRVQAIRDGTPIPEMDHRRPNLPSLDSNNLLYGVFEEVHYRGRPNGWSPGLLVDDLEGNQLRYSGYVIVSGAPEQRRPLQAQLQSLFESEDFNRLAKDIVRIESEMPTSPTLQAFEAKRTEVIQEIKWKHPGK